MARASASLAGIALFVAAGWGLLLAIVSGALAAQAPNPGIPDGDPCCGHPDTWGEVAVGFLWTQGVAAVVGVLFALSAVLLVHGASGRRLRWRPLARVPVAGMLLTTVAFGLALAVPP